jgi:hypothetical protein
MSSETITRIFGLIFLSKYRNQKHIFNFTREIIMSYGINAPQGLQPYGSITGGAWVEKYNTYSIFVDPTTGTGSYDTNLFVGDPVVFNPLIPQMGSIAQYNPLLQVGVPTTFSTLPILGSYKQVSFTDVTGKTQITNAWIGGTNVYPGTSITAYVADDPDCTFDIQVSTSVNAAANAFVAKPNFPCLNAGYPAGNGSFGSNFALNVAGGTNFDTVSVANGAYPNAPFNNNPAAGNTISGMSAFYLDVSTSGALAGDDADYNKRVSSLPLKAIGYSTNANNIGRKSDTNPTGLLALTPFINVLAVMNNLTYTRPSAGVSISLA